MHQVVTISPKPCLTAACGAGLRVKPKTRYLQAMDSLRVARKNPVPGNFQTGQNTNHNTSNNSGHTLTEIMQVEVLLTIELVAEEGQLDMTTGNPLIIDPSPNHIKYLHNCNRNTTLMICNNNNNNSSTILHL